MIKRLDPLVHDVFRGADVEPEWRVVAEADRQPEYLVVRVYDSEISVAPSSRPTPLIKYHVLPSHYLR